MNHAGCDLRVSLARVGRSLQTKGLSQKFFVEPVDALVDLGRRAVVQVLLNWCRFFLRHGSGFRAA